MAPARPRPSASWRRCSGPRARRCCCARRILSGPRPSSNLKSGASGPAPRSSVPRQAAIRQPCSTTRCRPPRRAHTDYVIVDTAGRLHTKTNLMAELEKMRRTAQRIIPGRAARNLAGHGRHHRAERSAAGAAVHRVGGRHRHRADQARRHRQGRRGGCDLARDGRCPCAMWGSAKRSEICCLSIPRISWIRYSLNRVRASHLKS